MNKKEKTAVIKVNPELQKNLEILSAVKAEADKIGNNCLQIVITDEATLSVAQQNLSSANQIAKTIEEKRKAIKQPYLDAGKMIDETCGQLTEIIERGISHVKTQVKMWEIKRQEEAKKAAEELAKKQEEDRLEAERMAAKKQKDFDYFNKCIASLKQMYDSSDSAEKCKANLQYIKNNFPNPDKFGDYAGESEMQRENYISMINTKMDQFERADNLSDAEKELIRVKEELMAEKARIAQKEAELRAKEEEVKAEAERKKKEAEAEAERLRLEAEQEAGKTKGARKIWKFELVDKTKLSEDWITMDETAVKEFLNNNKDVLKDGDVISGVKFWQDISIRA